MTEAGPRQSWRADRYPPNARFVAKIGAAVIELLAPRPGERIRISAAATARLPKCLPRSAAPMSGDDGPPITQAALCCPYWRVKLRWRW